MRVTRNYLMSTAAAQARKARQDVGAQDYMTRPRHLLVSKAETGYAEYDCVDGEVALSCGEVFLKRGTAVSFEIFLTDPWDGSLTPSFEGRVFTLADFTAPTNQRQ